MAPEQVVLEHPAVEVALPGLLAVQAPEGLDAVPESSLEPLAQIVIEVRSDALGFRLLLAVGREPPALRGTAF